MITSLTLDNFKCFEHFYMPLRPLTLIVGTNGAGKSSIIQSMLLLRQSCLDKDVDWRENLVINSGLVELDSASDILYASVEGKEARIYIEIENDDADSISFSINPETVDNVSQVSCEGDLDKAKKEWPLFDSSFVYLYADRVQPHAKYVKSISRLDSRLGDKTANNAVFRFAQAINTNENIAINSLRHKHAIDNSVYRNVGAWINDLMGSDIDVTAEEVEKGKEAKYVYSVTNKENESKNLSPLNMPFGQSYSADWEKIQAFGDFIDELIAIGKVSLVAPKKLWDIPLGGLNVSSKTMTDGSTIKEEYAKYAQQLYKKFVTETEGEPFFAEEQEMARTSSSMGKAASEGSPVLSITLDDMTSSQT